MCGGMVSKSTSTDSKRNKDRFARYQLLQPEASLGVDASSSATTGRNMSWLPAMLEAKRRQTHTSVLRDQFEAGGRKRLAAYEHLCESIYVSTPTGSSVAVPRMVVLALKSKNGSKLVQRAIDVASPDQQSALSGKLRGFVSCLATSKHGNYLIQKHAQTVPATNGTNQDVALEILADFTCIVTDKYGCRVVQRFLEHLDSSNPLRSLFIEDVLKNAADLCWDEYGHFPIETLLEHGRPSEQAHIVHTLLSDADEAYHGKGCFVVQRVLDLALLLHVLPLLPQLPHHQWRTLCNWSVAVARAATPT